MKEAFIRKQPRQETLALMGHAIRIIEQYEAQGYKLTLRQLYYRFVAADLVPNTERSYKNVGRMLDDARMLGLVDWDSIEDRTRSLEQVPHWRDPESIIDVCARTFRLDKWVDQPTRVEVWVEKEALAGVVERAANEMDVPWFSCRGYASASSMYEAGKRMDRYLDNGHQRVVVLHLGDHDPSGIDMTRDIQERLCMFARRGLYDIRVKRIALNMDQIEAYGPPPNPAKLTDSRAGDYVREYGYDSWELDALPPQDLHDLIVEHVLEHRDGDRFDALEQDEERHRELLSETSDRWDDVVDYLERS